MDVGRPLGFDATRNMTSPVKAWSQKRMMTRKAYDNPSSALTVYDGKTVSDSIATVGGKYAHLSSFVLIVSAPLGL